jgi:predicted DNA-binding ribbon-helix-helix protein
MLRLLTRSATNTYFPKLSASFLYAVESFYRALTATKRDDGQSILLTMIRLCFLVPTASNKGQALMKSSVVKRSIVLAGHKTSVSLEEAFWNGLKGIPMGRRQSLSDLIGIIGAERQHGNLSSAVRLFVLNHCQVRSSNEPVTHSGGYEPDPAH